jgi:putative N6-adenine-specific DNA methylase
MERYFAAAPRGVEQVTALELEAMGATGIVPDSGGIHFEGDDALLYRANIRLRTATRVLVPIREFSAAHAVMLYDQVKRMKWEKIIPPDSTIAVDCRIAALDPGASIPPVAPKNRSELENSHYTALKIKDAVVDRIRQETGSRPDVDVKNPGIRIHAFIRNRRCTLSLDSTGRSLHERGYRAVDTQAPLKENLAAAIVMLSGWDPGAPLLDPMCGSGTIPIEAGMIAMNIPPNLKRREFCFMNWRDFDKKAWELVLKESEAAIRTDARPEIHAWDSDKAMIAAVSRNASLTGVKDCIKLERRPVESMSPPSDRSGTIIMNPPYGKRIGSAEPGLNALYKSIGDALKNNMKGWTAHILTGNLETAKHVGLRTSKRHILYNGPIECRLLRYEMY